MMQVFSPVPFKTELRPCTDWFMSALINKRELVIVYGWFAVGLWNSFWFKAWTCEHPWAISISSVGWCWGCIWPTEKEEREVKEKLLNNISVTRENTLQLLNTPSSPLLYPHLPFSPPLFHLPSLVLCSDGLSRPFPQLFSTGDSDGMLHQFLEQVMCTPSFLSFSQTGITNCITGMKHRV